MLLVSESYLAANRRNAVLDGLRGAIDALGVVEEHFAAVAPRDGQYELAGIDALAMAQAAHEARLVRLRKAADEIASLAAVLL